MPVEKEAKLTKTAPATTPPAPAKPPLQTLGDRWNAAESALTGKEPPVPAAPAAPPPAPATPPPVPVAKSDKVVPEFKAIPTPTPPAPAAPEPPKPDAQPTPETNPHPPGSKDYNFFQLEQTNKTLRRQAEEAQAKLVELEKKAATPVVPPDYEALKTERDEISRKLQSYELIDHPLFKTAFDQKKLAIIEQAKALLPPEKAEAIADTMQMPAGKTRDARLMELSEELEPFQASALATAYMQQKMVETERLDNLKNAPDVLGKIKSKQAETLAFQQQQEKQQRLLFADNALARAASTWDEFRVKPGDDAHNQSVSQSQTIVRQWMENGLAPDALADVAVWAVRGIRGIDTETKLRGEIQNLQAQLNALSASQPNPAGSGSPAAAPAEDPKIPWSQRAAERFHKGPPPA